MRVVKDGAEQANPAPVVASNDRKFVLQAGRNCLELAKARRTAVLIDAANYYARLEQALSRANRSILIIGWDFDGRIQLSPDNRTCLSLGDFLRSLVEAHPELEVRILVWSAAVVHASSDPVSLLIGAPWQNHPRIILRLDQHHPLYAAHHQKMVAIDDVVAFVGGIDLTVERWDTSVHSDTNPLRVCPDGKAYGAVHDVQMIVDAEAASAVANVARDRWRIATGELLDKPREQRDIWPHDLAPDFIETPVAIARTAPAWGEAIAIREIAALTEDLLSAADRSIYIETQYFAASNVRRFMETSLAATRGPEIVVIVRRASPGTLERLVMGRNRDRLIRHLRRADRHNRLRFYYPVVPGKDTACEVLVHSKVLVIDDEIVRIGSSNFNNRSMGLDTECDLAIQATNDDQRRAIGQLRERLLAEHLGVTPASIAAAVASHGSLIRGIDACNRNVRGLRPFPETDLDGPTQPVFGASVLDPSRPLADF
jgi:phosphatidylserine/phosphatidylglycerophosphate/cardiolipin synthase-like enzyme